MGKRDPESLMFDMSAITPDDTRMIKFKDVCGKIGTKICTRAKWEEKCRYLYDEKYKDSKGIMIPSGTDKIMRTLSKLCAENQGRGFVFKNYDMVAHLEFLQYDRAVIDRQLGTVLKNEIITYLAYIEKKNIIFMCYSIKAGSPVSQYINSLTTSITYFLTLYSKIIESTEVKIVGLLIQENETKEKLIECAFCNLFSPTHKVFESPVSFNEWWGSIETYRKWWNLSNAKNFGKLFDNLAAQILGYMEAQKLPLSSSTQLSTTVSNLAPSEGLEPLRKSSAYRSDHTLHERTLREQVQVFMTANTFGIKDNSISRITEEITFRKKQLSKEHGDGKSQELKDENRPVSR